MNVNLLIDAIVRQTTVLIAQLATSGARASLAATANQVFLNLVRELKEQGLSNKLIADMFGLSLRTYHNKVRRLSESNTERGRPLWNAVLEFIQERGSVSRSDVLMRFVRDDGATVRSVLCDLADSGFIHQGSATERSTYRAANPDVPGADDEGGGARALANLVWIAVAQHSPITHQALREMVRLDDAALERAIGMLCAEGRVTVGIGEMGAEYSSRECVIPLGEPGGWEASVFDHYQAVVTAISTKLRRRKASGAEREWVGGSTYSFEIWPGHPLRDEVLGFLQAARDRASSLRARVDALNAETPPKPDRMKVIAYVGQSVIEHEEAEETAAP